MDQYLLYFTVTAIMVASLGVLLSISIVAFSINFQVCRGSFLIF